MKKTGVLSKFLARVNTAQERLSAATGKAAQAEVDLREAARMIVKEAVESLVNDVPSFPFICVLYSVYVYPERRVIKVVLDRLISRGDFRELRQGLFLADRSVLGLTDVQKFITARLALDGPWIPAVSISDFYFKKDE